MNGFIERAKRKWARWRSRTALFMEHPGAYLLLLAKQRKLFVSCDFKDTEVRIAVDSFFELENRVRSSRAEPELVAFIESMEPGSVFFDIGANVGTYSIFADKLGKGLKTFAFEPNAFTYAKLVQNVHANGCRELKTVPAALFREPKYSVLNIPCDELGTASCQFDDMTYKLQRDNQELYQGAFGFPLDHLIERFGFPCPQYVKIDVDGLELAVLAGMERTLASPALRQMFIEVTREDDGAVEKLLGRCGLTLRKRYDDARPAIYNCLFSR